MKTTAKLFLAAIMVTLVSCKPSPQKAQDYYTEITNPIESVLTKEDDLIHIINSMMNRDTADSNAIPAFQTVEEINISNKALDMAMSNLQLQIASSLNKLGTIPAFDKKTTLKDAATDMLTKYKGVSENEYPALLEIVKIPDSLFTPDDDVRFMTLSDSIDNLLQQMVINYIQQVKLFSQEYNFQLETDTVQ